MCPVRIASTKNIFTVAFMCTENKGEGDFGLGPVFGQTLDAYFAKRVGCT